MTISYPTYDRSKLEWDSDEERLVGKGRRRGVLTGEVYANAGHTRAPLESSKCMRSLHDSANVSTTIITSYGLSSHIPCPTRASQSRGQYFDSIKLNDGESGESWQKYQTSNTVPRQIGLTGCNLRSAQYQQVLDPLSVDSVKAKALDYTIAQVQPSSNPYDWEVPAEDPNITSPWAKASWARTNEIVRQKAGTLKRNAAVRRSRKTHAIMPSDGVAGPTSAISFLPLERKAFRQIQVIDLPTTYHSFDNENEKQREKLSITWEQVEEDFVLEPLQVLRVESEVVDVPEGRGARSRENNEPPHIARTFSEILGGDPFVPTALRDNE